MQEYDITLKRVLTRFTAIAMRLLTGFEITGWLNVEFPEVRIPRVDLLGQTAGGLLIHIELQSTNDPHMARRMLEYALAVHRYHGQRPEQLVLYVGEESPRMSGRLDDFGFECRIVDIREIDPEPLLASPCLADNVITILMRHRDERAALRMVLERIAAARREEQLEVMSELFILAGLRQLEPVLEKEIETMPILNDIMDHQILGPKLRKAREEGLREGRQEGKRGEAEKILARLIEKRFGRLPDSAAKRLEGMTISEIETAALRLLDAASLDELLGR